MMSDISSKLCEFKPSAIIPAAGKGFRMGLPKWKLKTASGQYFYQHLCSYYHDSGCETVLVINEDDYDEFVSIPQSGNFKLAVNPAPHLGRIYSIFCGFQKLSQKSACFIHNTDNPYISHQLISLLSQRLNGYDYALPQFKNTGGHPLLINTQIINEIMNLTDFSMDFRQLLQNFNGARISWPDSEILWNINTPEEYDQYLNKSK